MNIKQGDILYTLMCYHAQSGFIQKIVSTEQFLKDQSINVTIQFNGIELDGYIFQKCLDDLLEDFECRIKARYNASNIEDLAREMLEKRIEEIECELSKFSSNIADILCKV